jgi:hypothetical protein
VLAGGLVGIDDLLDEVACAFFGGSCHSASTSLSTMSISS